MLKQKGKILKHHSDTLIKLGSCQDLFLSMVVGKWTLDSVNVLSEHMTGFCNAHNKAGYICLVSKDAKVPDGEVRKAVAECMTGVNLIASAVIVERAKGFWGAAALGFMSALQSTARQNYPNKNFGNIEDAATWFAQETRERGSWTWSPTELSSTVKTFATL